MQSNASVEIDRPIEEVFRISYEEIARWSRIVESDEVVKETREVVGTTFRTVTSEHGKTMEFEGVVTRHEPPVAHAVYMTGQMFDIESEFRFERLGQQTRVTQIATVHGKGALKWFFRLFGRLMHKSSCKAAQEELNCLKQFCEHP